MMHANPEKVQQSQQALLAWKTSETERAQQLKHVRSQAAEAKEYIGKYMDATSTNLQRVGDFFIEKKSKTVKHALTEEFVSASYAAFNLKFKSHQVGAEELRCWEQFIEEQRVKLGKKNSTVIVRPKKPLDSLVFGDDSLV